MEWDLFEKIGKIGWTIPVLIWLYILYHEINFLNIILFVITSFFVSIWHIKKELQFSVGLNTRFLYIILSMVILDGLYFYSLVRIYKYEAYWEAHFLFWIGVVAIIYGHVYLWIKTSLLKDSIKLGFNIGQRITRKK